MEKSHPDYHNAPVPAFGDGDPRLLIVGLAPGAHGANASGRPFTGDFAGILLYKALHRAGLASHERSESASDSLHLHGCRITNAVKCLPPQNKPSTQEIDRCNAYLAAELDGLRPGAIVLALGTIAHRAVLKAHGLKLSRYAFAHGAVHVLTPERTLVDSYHCSRYNTQTGRLTDAMFDDVVAKALALALD